MTILSTPSAVGILDVQRFPTAQFPMATLPLSGNELMAVYQGGQNKYIAVSDLGGGGGGNFSGGVSNLGQTDGTTGLVNAQIVFAAFGNATLSQSAAGQSATISISVTSPAQSVQTQNLFDLTIDGNTAGVGALISSGTLTLAAGANVTLSQNGGNAITIIGPTPSGGAFSAGVSNLGNTLGSTGISGTQLVLAGINGVTLSQSTGANGATVTISGITQTVQTQNLHNVTLAGNSTSAGAGFIQISSGTMTLAGGNNITLSQNGNAVTISAFTQSLQTQSRFNLTLAGNSTSAGAGFIQISSGVMTLAGGNNVTLSQNGNAVTISAFTQTVQTQNLHNVTLSGNTAGAMAQISSGTMTLAGGNNITLSQAGNAVTISGANQTVQTQNLFALTITSNTAGVGALVSSGTLSLAGGANITLSQNGGNAITIIGPTPGGGGNFSAGVSNLGNTLGDTGVSGTRMVLAGINGVTLSQATDANGNTITISGITQSLQTQSRFNLTLAGNSTSAGAGFIQISSGVMTLAGGNNVTLSQNGNAVTVSAFNQTVQTQNMIGATLAGNSTSAGAGFILMTSGTMTLAGGNNITLSQNGNAVTISAFTQSAESNTFGMSNLGNTSGTSGVVSGAQVRYLLAGGNNVTLSQSLNGVSGTVTISAANQTVQTQNLHNVTLAGNSTSAGAGFIQISSGTMTLAGGNNITLSQNGNAVTISAGAGGGGGIAATVSGNSTSSGGGFANISTGTMTMIGGANITLNQDGNRVEWIGPAPAAATMDYITHIDLSSQATADFDLTAYSQYDIFVVKFENVLPATSTANLIMRYSTDGGSTYDSGASDYTWNYMAFTNAGASADDAADSSIKITNTQVTTANGGAYGTLELYDAANASARTTAIWTVRYDNTVTTQTILTGQGKRLADQDTTDIRFLYSSGNLASGRIILYGLRLSTPGQLAFTSPYYENFAANSLTNVQNITALSQRPVFVPFILANSLTWNRLAFQMSRSTSGSNLFTVHAALYSFVNQTQITRMGSFSNSYSATNTASISGIRVFEVLGPPAEISTLKPGAYHMMLYFSAGNTASMNYSLRGNEIGVDPLGLIGSGADNNTTATSQLSSIPFIGAYMQGHYTATTASPPGSVNYTQVVQGNISGANFGAPYFRLYSR